MCTARQCTDTSLCHHWSCSGSRARLAQRHCSAVPSSVALLRAQGGTAGTEGITSSLLFFFFFLNLRSPSKIIFHYNRLSWHTWVQEQPQAYDVNREASDISDTNSRTAAEPGRSQRSQIRSQHSRDCTLQPAQPLCYSAGAVHKPWQEWHAQGPCTAQSTAVGSSAGRENRTVLLLKLSRLKISETFHC